MTKLEVGQEVWLFGVGYIHGKVVSVTPLGVDVQGEEYSALFSFDNDGKETEESRCRRLGPPPKDRFGNMLWHGAPEWQPWQLLSPGCQATLDVLKAAIGRIWGGGKITKEMWEDGTRRYAANKLENAMYYIRHSDQKF